MSLKSLRPLILIVIIFALTSVFSLGIFLVFQDSETLTQKLSSIVLLVFAFMANLGLWIILTMRVLTTFVQHFYDIPASKAGAFTASLLFGASGAPALAPILEVRHGRIDLDGPSLLQKIGGPGLLRVAHDSAVVTQQKAKLYRILGPGTHRLEPFEKVWDTVDLRPQRRSIHINFMTSDGIPAYCNADIRFRVDGGHQEPSNNYPFPYLEQAVLTITTLKRARDAAGEKLLQDWTQRIANGILDGVIRNVLEHYPLDEFVNPRYWLPHKTTATPEPQSIIDLERQIEAEVRRTGQQIGVDVESVQLGPVLPSEGAIPRQWLEFWQARVQRLVDESAIEGDAVYTDLLLQAQVNAKVELVTTMLGEVHDLTQGGVDVPSQLIVLSFIDVLRSIAERDPIVQQIMFQQADNLLRIARDIV